MKICFFGVGGVGGYFGALVAAKFGNEHEIYFVARGQHKEAICRDGLTLKKAGGDDIINVTPHRCTDSMEDIPVCDIVVLSVKSYDLEEASQAIAKIAHSNTIVLPLLNGVDITERIRTVLETGIVLPSCVYVGTHIESPGVIYQKGGSCKISIGNDPKFSDQSPQPLLDLLKASKIDFEWEENVTVSIWSKYMFIAAYGLVTAAHNKTLGEVVEDIGLSQLTQKIMEEIEAIAQKLNIPLGDDMVNTSFLKAKNFPYETKTSFQRDIEAKGKINEGDLFGGTLIRYGKELGISTATTEMVYEKLLKSLS